jgi:hypothetical protein
MPVSPADFYAYSQATGMQVPDSPEERAQLAPQVLQFRRNQLKQPQEQGIDPMSMGVGIGLALAGAGAGALALRGRNRIPKSTKTTGQSGVKVEDLSRVANVGKSKEPTRQDVYQQVASKPVEDLPPVTRPQGGAETELIVDTQTGEVFRSGGGRPYADVMTGADLAAQVDEVAQNISQNALTDFQKRQAPALSDQQINAAGSGEDQMTGRVRQQLQRNEDLNLMQIDALEDVNQQIAPASSDAPITQAAAQTVDGIPVDQAEGFIGPITAQETLDLAKQDMIQRRQSLVEQGFQPGTVKFERALAQSFRTTANVQPRMTGETMQKTTLPAGPIRQTVQEVSASEYLPEYSVENIGPEAKITQTAMGTAIRGASPVIEQQPPITRERQVFGTADVNVPGAPNEMMSDRPARESALSQILIEPQIRQDPYAVTLEEGGGPAGIGVYGIESSYVPGAQSKSTGMYSAASQRKPTDVPYKEKKQGFAALDAQQLQNFIANAPEGRVREAGIKEQQRRQTTKQSLGVSEAMRRARIEGRDPQAVLRGMGFGV